MAISPKSKNYTQWIIANLFHAVSSSFTAKEPLRVIPACMIGSGLAGALAMFFDCTLMAPHGGIFVFPVVGNALYYLLALAAGMVVGGVLLGLIKRRVVE